MMPCWHCEDCHGNGFSTWIIGRHRRPDTYLSRCWPVVLAVRLLVQKTHRSNGGTNSANRPTQAARLIAMMAKTNLLTNLSYVLPLQPAVRVVSQRNFHSRAKPAPPV